MNSDGRARHVTTRRRFPKGAIAGAAVVPLLSIVPRHVLGGPGHTPPSDLFTRGTIGCGATAASVSSTPMAVATCGIRPSRKSPSVAYSASR